MEQIHEIGKSNCVNVLLYNTQEFPIRIPQNSYVGKANILSDTDFDYNEVSQAYITNVALKSCPKT